MSGARPPLSAVLITLNCARQLEPCLESLAFCDEIIVVDSGSSDGTVALAHTRGARVIHQDWLGFGAQKQFAVAQARHDWVLCVDSDERVTPELRVGIEAALAAPAFDAYEFPRRNRFMGRYLRHGEGYPDWSLRLFDRRQARWSEDAVHEKVIAPGPVGRLRGDLLHDTAETLESYLAKQARYTTLAAEEALAAGKRGGVARMLLSPVVRFIKFYFFRLGFLDGWPGLAHILIGCRNSYEKYAKLRRLQRIR
ncbi:MAG: glycosyltransferase family 2 protein [Burkholderiales bacterium]|nr:glycosyltransferase family 2 protein [Burkholderiales bacterium]